MSIGFRRGLALLFILGFVVSAPIVVLYTAGYRLNIKTGRLVQTGVLSINSVPRGATVLVDGKSVGSTPVLVKDVIPGVHQVTLQKDGFLPWEKALTVESRQTTFATGSVLSADRPSVELRDTPATLVAFSRTTGRSAYTRPAGAWNEVWAYDPRGSEDRLVARLPSINGTPSLVWSPDGTSLAVTVRDGKGRSATSLTNTDDGRRVDVSGAGAWDASSSALFFTKTTTGFSSTNLDGRTTKIAVSGDAIQTTADGYVVADQADDRTAILFRRNDGSTTLLTYLPAGTFQFVPSPDGLLALVDSQRKRICVLDRNGGSDPLLLDAAAEDWQWEPGGRRLLYTDGFELRAFNPNDRSDETLTRVSDPITGIAWRPQLPAAMYAQSNRVVSIEFDRRDGHLTTPLATGSSIQHLWTDPSGRTAYFFGTIEEKTGLFAHLLQ